MKTTFLNNIEKLSHPVGIFFNKSLCISIKFSTESLCAKSKNKIVLVAYVVHRFVVFLAKLISFVLTYGITQILSTSYVLMQCKKSHIP